MSFKKIQIINPDDIGNPENGHVYFGRDAIGFWEKQSNGYWQHITTGGTSGGASGSSGISGTSGVDGDFFGSSGTSGYGSSGTDGTSGSSGKSGDNGTSGISGSSGISGTSGTSGKSGSSGTSGISGTSGSSGTSGTSGSSGVDGNFYGSSGTSGYSGGYGAATRKWVATLSYPPGTSGFYGTSTWATGFDFQNIDRIVINPKDANGNILTSWLTTWQNGLLKIENINNPRDFGLYDINQGYTYTGGNFIFSGITVRAGYSGITNNDSYLISFINNNNGSSGTSGSVGNAGSSGTSGSDSSWITLSPSTYTSTPLSVSGITTSYDYSSTLKKGMALKWLSGTTYYYDEIINVTTNRIDVRGASLGIGECLNSISYSNDRNMIHVQTYVIPGLFSNNDTNKLLEEDLKMYNGQCWLNRSSTLVGFDMICISGDSASFQPTLSPMLNNNKVFDDELVIIERVLSSNNNSINPINVNNYKIDYGQFVEIKVTQTIEANNDSSDLTCYLTFVMESI